MRKPTKPRPEDTERLALFAKQEVLHIWNSSVHSLQSAEMIQFLRRTSEMLRATAFALESVETALYESDKVNGEKPT
jgi:hypothetical protein